MISLIIAILKEIDTTIQSVIFICMCIYMLFQIRMMREALFAKEASFKQRTIIVTALSAVYLFTSIIGESMPRLNYADFQSLCLYSMLFGLAVTLRLFAVIVLYSLLFEGTAVLGWGCVMLMSIFVGAWFKENIGHPWLKINKAALIATVMSALLVAVRCYQGVIIDVSLANFLAFTIERYLGICFLLYMVKKTVDVVAYDEVTAELQLARGIQKNMVPVIEPQGNVIGGYRVGAYLLPAKEVGGDWYDFAQRNNRLDFVLGDVSGKGMPAALFMSIACVFFRSVAAKMGRAIGIFQETNNLLYRENKTSKLFITACGGSIDMESGSMFYSSVGHTDSYIKRTATGELLKLPLTNKGVLGIRADRQYDNKEYFLQKGDILFCYTDGITEAQNGKKEFYGAARLESFLKLNENSNVQDILRDLVKNVHDFAEGAEQSDDITLLAIAKEV